MTINKICICSISSIIQTHFYSGAFLSCCMLVVSTSIVFTVLVLNLHHRKVETHEMNPFVNALDHHIYDELFQLRSCLIEFLPYVLMMRRPKHPFSVKEISNNRRKRATTTNPVIIENNTNLCPVEYFAPPCIATHIDKKKVHHGKIR